MLGTTFATLFVAAFVSQDSPAAQAAALLDRLDATWATPEARGKHPFLVLRGTIEAPGMPEKGSFVERHAPPAEGASAHERVLVTQSFAGWETSTQGTDGSLSWTTDPAFGVLVTGGDQQGAARRMWALSRSAPWRELYAGARVRGEVDRDGRALLELELEPRRRYAGAQPDAERWYVDPTGPELVAVQLALPNPTGGTLPMELVYGNWKGVDGIRYAHTRVQNVGTLSLTYRVEAIEHPSSLAATELAPPESVAAALADPAKRALNVPADLTACSVRAVEGKHVASVRATIDAAEVSANLAIMLPEVMAVLGQQGVQPVGPPFSRYHEIDGDASTIDIEAGIPVATPIEASGRVQPGELPAGRVATTWHQGPYHELPRTYARLEKWMKAEELRSAGGFWEVYWTDPGIEPDPASWKTEILWPLD